LHTAKKAYSWRLEKVLELKETVIAEKVKSDDYSFKVADSELAELIYTSGTTGFSKGVMLPHRSLRANVDFAIDTLPVKAGDPILSFLPLAHAYGCAFEFLYPFAIGAHITFLSKVPSPKIILKAFSEVKPKLILSVPLIIEKIYQRQIKPVISQPKMKVMLKVPILKDKIKQKICQKLTNAFGGNFIELIIGGAPLSKEVDAFLKDIGFRFLVGYGMSECGPLISYEKPDQYRTGTVGKKIPCLDVRIENPNDAGIGEIQVKGENVMLGYYKNEDATTSTFTNDGWLKTGDLGLLDEEGNIIIRGRSKSMLLGASGQNIYPEEIESMMNNLEIVSESLIIQRNSQLIGLVYPDYDKVDKGKVSNKELEKRLEQCRQTINQQLPSFSKIQKIEIMNLEFEKTPTKKIKRYLYQG
jgi:long-chain acyl-CoA synthetase